jgi:hypothetical protein
MDSPPHVDIPFLDEFSFLKDFEVFLVGIIENKKKSQSKIEFYEEHVESNIILNK